MHVRLVWSATDGERELAVDAPPGATLADVLATAGLHDPGVVGVDGRAVPTDHGVAEAGLRDGMVVRPGRPAPPPPDGPTRGRLRLSVVAGVDAGRVLPLDRPVLLGRAAGADLRLGSTTVSARHCRLTPGPDGVVVEDLGSTNGTRVDGRHVGGPVAVVLGSTLRLGAVLLRVEGPAPDDRPCPTPPRRDQGRPSVPWNRPPRPGLPPVTGHVQVPGPRPEPAPAPPFNVLALAAPVALGLVMVLLTGSVLYAAFMALSPVLAVANVVQQRRRSTAQRRRDAEQHDLALATLDAGLDRLAAAERDHRWATLTPVPEVLRRAEAPSTRLWERRADHHDALRLQVGVGDAPWAPDLRESAPGVAGDRPPEVREVLQRHARLARTPVAVDLAHGGVVGIVGAPGAARALARSLVLQAAVHHGPADLRLALAVDHERVDDWRWAAWLPHVGGGRPDDPRRLAAGPPAAERLLRDLHDADRPGGAAVGPGGGPVRTTAADRDHDLAGPVLLLVVDATDALRGRAAPGRALLAGAAGPAAGIVLAATEDALPAVCDTVVRLHDEDGTASVVRPADGSRTDHVLVAGVTTATALRAARRLARHDDPEAASGPGALPPVVHLLDLLPHAATERAVAAAWSTPSDRLAAPLGVGPDGPVVVDLVRDGPHGLVGGTTGSGKSELLRTLVAGLAANHAPDDVTFVLVDYKGGAAFDACADLPHVVGLVTDLDAHLGERALRSLEAELEHRERRLRSHGVGDLAAWRRLPPGGRGPALPRLVVVVDEFATLRAELPDFVDALVGVAQRGRSLGVHLVLGTQRPSGAVDENVRANANLRIALRVTDRGDSTDVVGVPDAADVPPGSPGRAVLRVGPAATVAVQTALVTGRRRDGGGTVRVAPVRFGPTDLPSEVLGEEADEHRPSDLQRLVAACRAAWGATGAAEPRRPWLPPLPARLGPDELPAGPPDGELAMAVVDLPDQQRRAAAGWDPGRGPLLLHGTVGAGTTTTVLAAVLAAARARPPSELHVQVLDLGRGALSVLAGLPHVGAVVTAGETERRDRLLRGLLGEAERRRGLDHGALADEPVLLVVVDGLEALLADLDGPATYERLDEVVRLVTEAAGLRIAPLLTTTRVGGLRAALTSAVAQRWVMRLADPGEVALLGLRPEALPAMPPGRAVRVEDGAVLQVAAPEDPARAVAEVAALRPPAPPGRRPDPVATLPASVAVARLTGQLHAGDGAWRLPVGVADDDLGVVRLPLHHGEHALLLGPTSSGRSGALGALARVATDAGLHVVVTAGVAGSPLLGDGHRVVAPERLGAVLRELADGDRDALVLVDDAERVPDPGAPLDAVDGVGARVHVVAAARGTVVRADFGCWVRRLARSGVGAVLRPGPDASGDVLAARLPRRPPAATGPGRAWVVVEGDARFAQLAAVDA